MTTQAEQPSAGPRPDLIDTLRALTPLDPADALPDDLNAELLPLQEAPFGSPDCIGDNSTEAIDHDDMGQARSS